MFNLKNFKLVKELKNVKPQLNWLKFTNERQTGTAKADFINSVIEGNKFVEDELKIRAMVEEMLEKEFSPDIKNIKGYDFLVDSVVNKLKQKQLNDAVSVDENQINN